jgi:hypothetical protein
VADVRQAGGSAGRTWGYVCPEWTGRGLPDDPGPADWFARLALGWDPGPPFVLYVPQRPLDNAAPTRTY